MNRQDRFACLSAILVLVLTACQVEPDTPLPPPVTNPAPTTEQIQPNVLEPTSTVVVQEPGAAQTLSSADPAVAQNAAIEALAATTGVDPASITVVDQPLPVQWNDSSLGCPQPDQVYAQVITPGYLYRLMAADTVYSVHTDLMGAAIVCHNETDPIGSETVPDPVAAEFIAQVSADLARRLNVPPESIVLVSSEAVEWSDAGIGCPQPDEVYAQVITFGYRIILARDEAHYEYHTDQHRMVLCSNPTE